MPPFVGRQPELAVLRARLGRRAGRAAAGGAHQGPAGIGKTALVEQFLAEPRRTPAPVVVCGPAARRPRRCWPTACVEQLARSAGPAGRRAAGRGDRATRRHRVHDPVTVGTRILELLGRARRPAPVSCWWSTTCTGPTCPRSRRWCSRCAGWSPTRCWPCSSCATTPTRSCRRACAGWSAGTWAASLRLRGLDEQDLRDLAAELGVDGVRLPARAAAALRHRRATRCTPGRCWRSSRPRAGGDRAAAAAAAAAVVPPAGGRPLRGRAPRPPAG